MAETGELRDGVEHDAMVRSFARAVERPCARPGCPAPARATLTFRYGTREAWIERLTDTPDQEAYDLCALHAARTFPPRGWDLLDRRPEDERHPAVPHTTPVDLGGDRTVAVLAAALRSVPDPVSEDAVADHAEVDRAVVPMFSTDDAPHGEHAPAEPEPAEPELAEPELAGPQLFDPGPSDPDGDEAGSARLPVDDTGPAHDSGADTDASGEPEPWIATVPAPRPPLAARQREHPSPQR